MDVLKSKVLSKFGDNISTDDMAPGKYMAALTPEEWWTICMKEIDPDFPKKMAPGGIVVAGKNFGCGSSREAGPAALKGCNVQAIIADDYARIFYRNCINIALPVIECKGIADKADLNDELEIEFTTGVITNLTKNETYQGSPIPPFLMEKINAGGLLNVLREESDQ